MENCTACGAKRRGEEFACPVCGAYYSKLDELLAEEAAEIEQKSFKGRVKRILASEQAAQEFVKELGVLRKSLPLKAWFSIFVSFCFIFALILAVL